MQNLYLIECQGYYKIGVASDIKARLAQLSTGNPFPLKVEIYYVFENAEIVERVLHQKYADKRVRGEWFDLKDYNELKTIHEICFLLGGSAYEYVEDETTNEDIEEAESIQESDYFTYDPESMRTEVRMANGSPRGVVVITRSIPKKSLAYIGKSNPEFEKYIQIYKDEHPNGNLLVEALPTGKSETK